MSTRKYISYFIDNTSNFSPRREGHDGVLRVDVSSDPLSLVSARFKTFATTREKRSEPALYFLSLDSTKQI